MKVINIDGVASVSIREEGQAVPNWIRTFKSLADESRTVKSIWRERISKRQNPTRPRRTMRARTSTSLGVDVDVARVVRTAHRASIARRRALRTPGAIASASNNNRREKSEDAPATARTPNGGGARSFVGASFYEDPYDTRGGGAARGMATARELASARRGLSGPMSRAARRAKGAMRPADGARKRNRAEEAIDRRRALEREMRGQLLETEVKREVESLVKQRVRALV